MIRRATGYKRMGRLALLTKMLMVYPTSNATSESGKARAEAYLETLSDIAPWAIDVAIRKWHRGECRDKYNYEFAPAPATLLKSCRLEGLLSSISLAEAMEPNLKVPTLVARRA
jgi:hypothetical protein